ncbi:hypothetical protein COH93_01870 [Neisseria meningitidis]|nr:hypothetical protein COH93_01870 [Neisseria meningitidis]
MHGYLSVLQPEKPPAGYFQGGGRAVCRIAFHFRFYIDFDWFSDGMIRCGIRDGLCFFLPACRIFLYLHETERGGGAADKLEIASFKLRTGGGHAFCRNREAAARPGKAFRNLRVDAPTLGAQHCRIATGSRFIQGNQTAPAPVVKANRYSGEDMLPVQYLIQFAYQQNQAVKLLHLRQGIRMVGSGINQFGQFCGKHIVHQSSLSVETPLFRAVESDLFGRGSSSRIRTTHKVVLDVLSGELKHSAILKGRQFCRNIFYTASMPDDKRKFI